MNSFNHYALGSCGQWLFDTVAGIRTDSAQPGFRRIVIVPHPGGGLTWARARACSIRGPITSAWKVEGGKFTLDVTIPVNTTATVLMPAGDGKSLTESGKPIEQAEGVTRSGKVGDIAVLEIGSGTYHFESR